jgi:hypothetical protein
MAGNAGLSHAEISAAASDGLVTGIDPEYVLICRATDELSQAHTLTDETLTALLDTFGAATTRRYVAMIAWFNLLSLFLNGTRVPLETTDKIGSRTSPI